VIQSGRKSLSANGTLDPLKVDAPLLQAESNLCISEHTASSDARTFLDFGRHFLSFGRDNFFKKKGFFNGHAWLRKLFQTPLPTGLSVEDYFQFTHFIYASIDGD
jgi:hypothetical protein